MTKPRDIVKAIRKAAKAKGLEATVNEGGSHTHLRLDGLLIPLPRHREVNENTTRAIYKQAAEKLGKDWWRP